MWPEGSLRMTVRSPWNMSFGGWRISAPAASARSARLSTSGTKTCNVTDVPPPSDAGAAKEAASASSTLESPSIRVDRPMVISACMIPPPGAPIRKFSWAPNARR